MRKERLLFSIRISSFIKEKSIRKEIKEYTVERIFSVVLKYRFKDPRTVIGGKLIRYRQITSILSLRFFLVEKTWSCIRSKNTEMHLETDLWTVSFYDNILIRFCTTSRATSRHIYDLVVAQFLAAIHNIFLPIALGF